MRKFVLLTVAAGCFWLVAPLLAKEPPTDAASDLDLARRLEGVFERIAAQSSESVVVITTKTKAGSQPDADEDEDDHQQRPNPFDYFFHHHPGPQSHEDTEGQGSGVILRADGYILTNGHVVDGADEIKVRLKDDRELDAKLVGIDPHTDIAVIKVEAKDLPVARLADSDQVKVGQWAVAIGAPFELDYSFTVGFVSAKGRSAVWSHGGSAYEDYIQTDAAINPGNSGGPLCDIEGRVIGINTLIRVNTGIGFAIPINMAREISTELIEKGRIVRPWIGIHIESLAENRDLTETLKDGVVVRGIEPNAPAAKSDLKLADIIVAVDGVPVKTPRELQQQILRKKVGQELALDVVRDGKPAKVKLMTAEMADARPVAAVKGKDLGEAESAFGLTVQTLSKELAKQLGVEATDGVIVTDVPEDGLAAEKGLQRGDIITEVNRVPIHNAEEFKAAIDKVDPEKGALLFMKRGDVATFEVLKAK